MQGSSSSGHSTRRSHKAYISPEVATAATATVLLLYMLRLSFRIYACCILCYSDAVTFASLFRLGGSLFRLCCLRSLVRPSGHEWARFASSLLCIHPDSAKRCCDRLLPLSTACLLRMLLTSNRHKSACSLTLSCCVLCRKLVRLEDAIFVKHRLCSSCN